MMIDRRVIIQIMSDEVEELHGIRAVVEREDDTHYYYSVWDEVLAMVIPCRISKDQAQEIYK